MTRRTSTARRMLLVGGLVGCSYLSAGVAPAQQPAAPARPEPSPFKVVVDSGTIVIHRADKPVLRYRYGNVPFKPYLDYLCTPSGVNVLRDSPADHKHHHALMFALSADGVDFWSELQVNGLQLHQATNDVRIGAGGDVQYAGFAEDLAWVEPKGRGLLLGEGRRIELVQPANIKATLVTWESFLEVPEGKKNTALSGSEYFGLGMRFVQSMDTGGKFFNADGKTGVEGTNAVRSRWCAYSAGVNGKPVTVAVFDHPANPRQPATWFTMTQGFAYLAATLDLSKQLLTLAEDRPMLLRYGVALWDGNVDGREVEAVYRRWADLFQMPAEAPSGQPSAPAQSGTPAAPPAPR